MDQLTPIGRPDHDLDFIVVGRAGMDLYPTPNGTKTKHAQTFVSDMGGSAGNIAVAMAKSGARVGLAAPVSDDPVGRFVAGKIAEFGLEHITPNPITGEPRTSLALAETISDGSETVIYRNDAADFQLKNKDLSPEVIARTAALVVTGTALAQDPSQTTCLKAMAVAEYTVLDLDYRPYSWPDPDVVRDVYSKAIAHCAMVVGNDEEFDRVSAPDISGQDYARSLAASGKVVIYKMGAKGSLTYTPNMAPIETGVFQVEALKPFGAGDAFLGGLLAALAKGAALENALTYGSAAAALVVAKVGCAGAMPSHTDIEDFIEKRS